MVVGQLRAEAGPEVALCNGHADAVGDALTERAGGDLDASRMSDLGMAGRCRPPLAEFAEIVKRQAMTSEVQHRVQQDGCVAGREDEPVAVGPRRIVGVVGQDPGPQHVGQRRQCHGGPLMARTGGVGRVHRQTANHVNGPTFVVNRLLLSARHDSHLRPPEALLEWIGPDLIRGLRSPRRPRREAEPKP